VALLNDARLSNNQKPLGFLNPLLYSKGVSGFNDITVGHNSGCGTLGFNVSFSFRTKRIMTNYRLYAGYEGVGSRSVEDGHQKGLLVLITVLIVTGLGTPNFGKLKELVTS
jgi:hypothetical protein